MNNVPFDFPLIFTVSAITSYLRELFESDEVLQDVWVRGEVSNFSRSPSGHLYFSLKDSEAQVRCVMWKNAALRLSFLPRDGLAVEAHGSMNIYPASGQVQLYVDSLRPGGEGALYQEFLRLKARLEAEGLFDPAHKRPLPPLPAHIGIVTSATGAALQDMLHTLSRRLPLVHVTLAPTAVQGVDAPGGIIAALQHLNQLPNLDVILLARGGGSIEDLWAFNDEHVARAIYQSRIPVISGVGHETDFTIADFVADLRAPTPTAAAELATPITVQDLADGLRASREKLASAARAQLDARRSWLSLAQEQLKQHAPHQRIRNALQRQDDLRTRLDRAIFTGLANQSLRLAASNARLEGLNPLAVLRRGYALLSDATSGAIVSHAASTKPGQLLQARLQDGSLSVEVKNVRTEGENHE